MNYYHETTHIRPRVYCADGISLSIQASEYAYCHPRQRYNRPWTFYSLVEVGYIYDKNTQPFAPPDIWREYQSGNDEIWAYVPVSVVKEFIDAHGGEVEAPLDPFVEKIIEETIITMNTTIEPFTPFPKMARLQREVIITEKIDGTNAQIYITDDGRMLTGSRTRWITPEDDNFGFAKWARDNKDELMQLGPGRHFGEWWGQGIQRKYGLNERRFSLFNVSRWCLHGETPKQIPTGDPRIVKMQEVLPACCHLVPVLWQGLFTSAIPTVHLHVLEKNGSKAAPGFMNPEGIVVFHVAGNVGFKMTLDNDGVPKSSLK